MLFSVVIPTYNRLPLLQETLESVRAQTFTDFEIIVVDDGSTDGTSEYLRRHAGQLRVIEQTQQGPGAARNAGAQVATGEYLAFLDSDDWWFPWTLAAFARFIEESRPSSVAGQYVQVEAPAQAASIVEQEPAVRRFADYFASAAHAISAGSGTVVVSRRVFNAIGGFVELPINGEDHDLMLRLGEAPGFLEVLAPVTLAWRRHPGGVTASLQRSIDGMTFLVERERAGRYPGGQPRASERRRIITRHVRPVSLSCLRAGRLADGFALYRSTFGWHWRQRRFGYLAVLPVLAAWSWLLSPFEASRS